MAMYQRLIVLVFLYTVNGWECYEDKPLRGIPTDHVYHKLRHPCVIGHMGNIQQFQENTMQGIKNLIEIKADGVHMHVSMTSDNQLVLLQDKKSTCEDFEVSALPYSEILKMNLLKNVPYYKTKGDYSNVLKRYSYGSTSKIPLLRDVLLVLKGNGMLVYIELMPNEVATTPLARYIALKTAELVAGMIKELQMERQILVVSRDATHLLGVNFNHPDISFGWMVDDTLYSVDNAKAMKLKYGDFPRVYRLPLNCLNKTGATGFPFTKYLVTSGFISKAVNASFIDFSLEIYDDTDYYRTSGSSSLKDVVMANYGGKTSLGAFNIFTWNDTKTATEAEDKTFINTLKSHGVTRILTNDVNRVKRALDEEIIVSSNSVTTKSYMEFLIMVFLLGKTMVMLVYG